MTSADAASVLQEVTSCQLVLMMTSLTAISPGRQIHHQLQLVPRWQQQQQQQPQQQQLPQAQVTQPTTVSIGLSAQKMLLLPSQGHQQPATAYQQTTRRLPWLLPPPPLLLL
jgi:hypothetical protein